MNTPAPILLIERLRARWLPADVLTRGTWLVLASTACFGLAPILGKLAYRAQVEPFTLVSLRTVLAALALWAFYLLQPRWRAAIAIPWHALPACAGMALANGFGSLLYYTGLARVDASLGQLLYTLYPLWVFIFLSAAGHRVSRLAVLRLGVALGGVYLLTAGGGGPLDALGIMLMISAGALYGWMLVLGQWAVADVDSRTVTLYVLTVQAGVVFAAQMLSGAPLAPTTMDGWTATVLLALIPTALARLLMFAGLRHLGGVQASLLGVAELVVALVMAFVWLGERLPLWQVLGAGLVVASVLLSGRESHLETSWEDLLREGRWRELE
ncbi:MAG: DMT family transporter [Chloroflexi bacterium]|nr:DMT family transporter [Chloroflexota bacterium]MBU1751408.1 DMT family transporter [Chloroflexota bacterium]MBU1879725.1 DMT family transporter [Chloroflexota bacterium]